MVVRRQQTIVWCCQRQESGCSSGGFCSAGGPGRWPGGRETERYPEVAGGGAVAGKRVCVFNQVWE